MLGILTGLVWILCASQLFETGKQLWMIYAIAGCVWLILGVYDIITTIRRRRQIEFLRKRVEEEEASNNDETKGEK